MSTKTKVNDVLSEQVARLTGLVEEQQRLLHQQRSRLDALESKDSNGDGGDSANGNGNQRHSRRELLRLAGLAAAGAAGAAGMTALQTLPAAAANGGNFILGVANNADGGTDLTPTTAAPAPTDGALFEADGSVTGTGTPVPATANFFRAIRGVAPNTPNAGPSGVGVWGTSDQGVGVLGSSGSGVDFWAFNSGRLIQAAQPPGAPSYQGGIYDTSLTPPAWTDFEVVRDGNGVIWIYLPPATNGNNVAANNSSFGGGTWIPLQPGGLGQAGPTGSVDNSGVLFTALTTTLQGLHNSDGATFQDMTNDTSAGAPAGGPDLVMNITPSFNTLAILTGNADLYTDTLNVNQDIGIYVDQSNLTTYPQHIVAWKESGGPIVNGPNAAFVQTVYPMTRGTTYNVRMKWKANKSTGATIRAGAGPFPVSAGLTHVSPTRLTAVLVASGV